MPGAPCPMKNDCKNSCDKVCREHGKSCNEHGYKSERQWRWHQSVDSGFSAGSTHINLLTNPAYGQMMRSEWKNIWIYHPTAVRKKKKKNKEKKSKIRANANFVCHNNKCSVGCSWWNYLWKINGVTSPGFCSWSWSWPCCSCCSRVWQPPPTLTQPRMQHADMPRTCGEIRTPTYSTCAPMADNRCSWSVRLAGDFSAVSVIWAVCPMATGQPAAPRRSRWPPNCQLAVTPLPASCHRPGPRRIPIDSTCVPA